MSLCTDQFFASAIKQSSDIRAKVGTRIFDPAVPVPDEELDNVEVPYIVIGNEGTTGEDSTKDDVDGVDRDTISILIVESSREELAALAEKTRKVLRHAIYNPNEVGEFDFNIEDYSFSASGVTMDINKPCDFQTLNYVCETTYND